MVDIGIASASSGPDAVSLLRSGRSSKTSDDSGNGFFDALTNSSGGRNSSAADTDDTTDHSQATSDAQTPATELPKATVAGAISLSSTTDAQVTVPATPMLADPTLNMPVLGATLPVVSDASKTAATTTTGANATLADAMASLGVVPDGDAGALPIAPPTGTTVQPADGNAAALPTGKAGTPSLASTLAAIQQQTTSSATQVTTGTAVTHQPDTDATAQAPAASQPADLMQQLAAIVGNDGTVQAAPVQSTKTSPTDTTGKTSTTPSVAGKDDDTAKDDAAADSTSSLSGAVTDALSLLNSAVPAAAAAQAQTQAAPSILAAAGQLPTASGKSQTSANVGSATAVLLPGGKTSTAAATDTPVTTASSLAALKTGTVGSNSDDTASTSDDSTQAFRITRASTKVQGVDLASSKSTDDSTRLDIKATAGSGVETVTVLDSRRYLGLADGSNSAIVANTLVSNKDWASAMKAGPAAATTAIATSTSKVVNTLKIQMNPEKLGTVTATMRLSGDALSVDLKVQSAEAYRQLSNDQGPMIDSLRSQGYTVDHITVSYTPQATTDSGSQQNNSQAGFQGQQQSGASQGQGGEAQSRRQNSGQRTGDQDGIWGTQNVGTDDSAAGNTQRSSSAGVYI